MVGAREAAGASAAPKAGSKTLYWVVPLLIGLALLGGFAVLSIGALAYVGSVAPDTFVYVGNRVPARFIQVARDKGALAPGETIRYFYSDGFPDVEDGFYLVSDRGVSLYSEQFGSSPLIKLAFSEIQRADLYRDTSFFIDSEITLTLKSGTVVSFPVSSERDRDELFHQAIVNQLSKP